MQKKVQREKESCNGTIVAKMEQWKKIVTPQTNLMYYIITVDFDFVLGSNLKPNYNAQLVIHYVCLQSDFLYIM